jgi:hypothetical protein
MPDDCWLIIDKVHSRAEHLYRLHWLLQDFPLEHQSDLSWRLNTPKGNFYISCGIREGDVSSRICRADAVSDCGWSAPFYFHREPALALVLTCEQKSALFWTLLSPMPLAVDSEMTIRGGSWSAKIEPGRGPGLLKHIGLFGAVQDEMLIEH